MCTDCERPIYAKGKCRQHYAAAWALAHREERRAASARWREANRELSREYVSKWSIRNRPRRALTQARRRARIAGAGIFLVTDRDLRRLLNRYRGACAYCAERLDARMHWDHVLPIARGGRHSIGNLAPACPECNHRKNAKLVIEFRSNRKGL